MVGIRLARLETQALSASGHERMVSGRVRRSGREDLTYPKRSAGSVTYYFAKLEAIRVRLALYEELSNRTPKPFAWKFTRQDMLNWLKRASTHFLAASAA